MHKLIAATFVLALAACANQSAEAPAAPPEPEALTLIWRTPGFAQPESVALSDDGSFLYVSNVAGTPSDKDGVGFISRLSVEGELLQREWVSGLNAPKGLLRSGDALYVTDIDQVVAIDARTGAIRSRTPVPDARFLNDITETPAGLILFSDTGAGRIFALRNGAAEVWLEDPLLGGVNGFLPEASRLIVLTTQGRLLAIDYQSRAISVLSTNAAEGDGVGALGEGRYITSAYPGDIRVIAADGTHRVLVDERATPRAMNDNLLVGDVLYQTHMRPGEVSAYRVTGVR